MAYFFAYGSDVLKNPNVNSQSGTGQDGAGQVTISNGTQLFADDALIRFETQNETASNELNGGSSFVGMTVFATAQDYLNNAVLYDYTPQNPGQSASIQNSVDGIGDSYVRFNANVLTSSDAGAPNLSSLFVAPGSDVATTATSGGTTVFERHTDHDYDNDGTIAANTVEDGNGAFNLANGIDPSTGPVVCVAPDTLFPTPNGPRAISDLASGDWIIADDGHPHQIIAITDEVRAPLEHHAQIYIPKGALGNDDACYLSGNHGVEIEAQFGPDAIWYKTHIRAELLVGQRGIRRVSPNGKPIRYMNLMLATHETVVVHGLPIETMVPSKIHLPDGCDVEIKRKRKFTALLPRIQERLQSGKPTYGFVALKTTGPSAIPLAPITINHLGQRFLRQKQQRRDQYHPKHQSHIKRAV